MVSEPSAKWGEMVNMLSRYGEPFYVQEYVRTPTGWPWPNDYVKELGDSTEIIGLFVQDSSNEGVQNQVQGIRTGGRFATSPGAPVDELTTLRRASNDKFYRLIGDPLVSPGRAFSQLKVFASNVIDRPLSVIQD